MEGAVFGRPLLLPCRSAKRDLLSGDEGSVLLKRLVIRIVGVVLPVCLLAGGAALAPERASSSSVLGNALDVALGRTKSFGFKAPISPAVSQMLLDQTGALNRRAAESGIRPRR